MTFPLLLPAAVLVAAPALTPQSVTQPVQVAAPAAAQASAPAAAADAQQPPAPAPSAAPAPAPAAASPELADPLLDPATQPAVSAQEAASQRATGDPFEGFNRAMFSLNQALDRAFYRPLAMAYQHVLPRAVRSGLRNLLSNLTEPAVFLNDLLQLKFHRAGRTLVRFLVNTTIGLGGLIDVAQVDIPHEDNSFGDTLAFYGVRPGPYLFLPLAGPTTLRDVLGGPFDGAILPVAVGTPFSDWRFQLGNEVVQGLDQRAEADSELRALFDGAVDPYATLRSVWLQNRVSEVEDLRARPGKAAVAPELADPLSDPAAPPSPSPAASQPTVAPAPAEPAPMPN